jgi:uncharacterized protein YgiM (DUF1202 family)
LDFDTDMGNIILHIRCLIIILCFLPLTWVVVAQETLPCASLVQTTVESTQNACEDIQADKACYRYDNVTASPYPQITDFQFQTIGDLEDITDIASLETEAADIEVGLWGIARLDIEARILGTAQSNSITMLLFGDVEIINNFEPDSLLAVVNASNNVNVRSAPSTNALALGVVTPGESLVVSGRNADSSWLRIRSDEFQGWLSQDFIVFEDDVSRTEIIASLSDLTQGTFYSPMQAFSMRSGYSDSACAELPQSGLIIQTLEVNTPVNIRVNDISIEFNSTIHLQTSVQDGKTKLTISTLQGETQIESQTVTQSAERGQTISVELDENGAAADSPSNPVPLDSATVNALPSSLLPRNICVPAPYQAPAEPSALINTNLVGVNLDQLHPLGAPNPERLGNLGWVRLNYNVSNALGSVDLAAAYERYQPLLEQYTENGYQTILVLTHQTYGEAREELLPWEEMTDAKWQQLSDELAIMACQIAHQYANQGLVSVYQVWNEQDAPIGARASIPMSAENYAYMLTQVSDAIRAADPNALIITGGFAAGPGDGAIYAYQMLGFLPSIDIIDGIAFHPYGRAVEFNSPYRVYGNIDVSIQSYSRLLPDKPLWITEWGVLDRPSDPAPEIAEYAISMLNYVDESYGERVAAMLWYAWADGMDNGYGLVDGNDNPKLSLYEQFTNFMARQN